MRRNLYPLILSILMMGIQVQRATAQIENLSFDANKSGDAPTGWSSKPSGSIVVDDTVAHDGHKAALIRRNEASDGSVSVLLKELPLDFSGKEIELRGFIRTERVSGYAALWMREEKNEEVVEFDNMKDHGIQGTTGWIECSIHLPLQRGAQQLFFGVLGSGTGKTWVSDLRLLVDGKPISQAPKVAQNITPSVRDRQFDLGSQISLSNLTQTQIDNLVILGKVWGFLKYHHPQVTSGRLQWDYELFRILPKIIGASDRAAARIILLEWISGLGTVQPCTSCVFLETKNIQLRPDLAWIKDETLLGKDLARVLQSVYKSRLADKQFYVSLVPTVANPLFNQELSYRKISFPDTGFQILALYRFWNIVAYWYPYRNDIGRDWDSVLREFLPRIALAKSTEDYQRELIALIAQIHDTHANLWSSLSLRPPVGKCRLPVNLRFIDNEAVVTGYATATKPLSDLKVGDVITHISGKSVDELVQTWSPYYADSNDAALLRDISQTMTNGSCDSVTVGLLRDSHNIVVKTTRVPTGELPAISYTHDLSGDTFRMLSDQVAYLKLSSVKASDIATYFQRAADTKGLIVDIRNYPAEFVVFALGSHLVERQTSFAKFTIGDLSNPGAFHWTAPVSIEPIEPIYTGKIVVLIDEVTQSNAEYTAMALRSAPHTTIIGSTTAGADGNVSTIPIPGGFRSMISGIGVFYPNGKPTQRIGITPDKRVLPTKGGIQTGRDEVLEEGIRQILGQDTSIENIRKIVPTD